MIPVAFPNCSGYSQRSATGRQPGSAPNRNDSSEEIVMATEATKLSALFWSKVDVRSDAVCWPWTAGKNEKGYGKFQREKAHRVAYRLWHGVDAGEAMVCHRCDNPECCNPAHLFLGDAAANNADRTSKGRTRAPSGERHGRAKLTTQQVEEIRSSPEKGVALARRFGVAASTISEIRSYRWRRAG